MVTPSLEKLSRQLSEVQSSLTHLESEWLASQHLTGSNEKNAIDNNSILAALNEAQAVLSASMKQMEKSQLQVDDLAEQMHSLRSGIQSLLISGHYFAMVPASPFVQRLFQDNAFEKQQVAYYVANHMFTNENLTQRCFIQSSTIAYFLLQCVDALDIDRSCLIYTNSAVAPIPLLFGRTISRHSIWPFRGHLFDNACGGWLIPANDQPSINALRDLFRRENDPLETAFIAPRYLTPNDGVFFEREEGAFLANELATGAKNVVLLAVGDRVLPSKNSLPQGVQSYPALQKIMAAEPQKITAVISWPRTELLPEAHQLKKSVGTLMWQHNNAGRSIWTKV